MKNNNKKNKKKKSNGPKMERDDKLEIDCMVIDALPGPMFTLRVIDSETEIIATLSGKIRQNRINIIPGDQVTCEVSPYDLTRGRIMWRKK